MGGTSRARQWWTPEEARADVDRRDPDALPAFDAFVAAAQQAGLDIDSRQTMDPKLALVVTDARVGKLGDVAVVSYQPNGAVQLELDFASAGAESKGSARGRVEALLGQIGAIDDRLGSMAAQIREAGLDRTHPNTPLRERSPESVSALVELVARFNAGTTGN